MTSAETNTLQDSVRLEVYPKTGQLELLSRHDYIASATLPDPYGTNGETVGWAASLEERLIGGISAGDEQPDLRGYQHVGTQFLILNENATSGILFDVPVSGMVKAFSLQHGENDNWSVDGKLVGRKRDIFPRMYPKEPIIFMNRIYNTDDSIVAAKPQPAGPVKVFFDKITKLTREDMARPATQPAKKIPEQRRRGAGGRLLRAIGFLK